MNTDFIEFIIRTTLSIIAVIVGLFLIQSGFSMDDITGSKGRWYNLTFWTVLVFVAFFYIWKHGAIL